MAITLNELKDTCLNANIALKNGRKGFIMDVKRGEKGYNIYMTNYEGSSTVAVGLTGKEVKLWLAGFILSLSIPADKPVNIGFDLKMITEHFEGFVDYICEEDGWEEQEEVIMAREAIASAKLNY